MIDAMRIAVAVVGLAFSLALAVIAGSYALSLDRALRSVRRLNAKGEAEHARAMEAWHASGRRARPPRPPIRWSVW